MLLAGCNREVNVSVSVSGTQMVELPADSVFSLLGQAKPGYTVVIRDANSEEIPYQLTHDGLLIFPRPALVGEGQAVCTIRTGHPAPFDTLVCGRQYPERLDDIAWENDRSGYRIYGPASHLAGNRLYGYDIFTKNVARPVLEERYALDLNPIHRANIRSLREMGHTAEADSLQAAISYHVDHGEGMDAYDVGPTLGGGASAIISSAGELLYQKTYDTYEVLDNGPLRFTVRLTYAPLIVGHDSAVVETRTVQLDKGAYLNKTSIRLTGLTAPVDVAAGCVIHRQSPAEYSYSASDGFIACADSTSNPSAGHGVVFIGLAFPDGVDRIAEQHFAQPLGSAIGQVMAILPYHPGTELIYHWGSGWSHADVRDLKDWELKMRQTTYNLRQSAEVDINLK